MGTWSGDLWNVIWILCTIQAMGLLKGVFASILRRDPIMFFMSMYGMLYMTSLLPAMYFAMMTINKKSWGTSGRKTILKNYSSLIPLVAWACILIPGIVYTTVVEVLKHKDSGIPRDKMIYLSIAFGSYIVYWFVILTAGSAAFRSTSTRRRILPAQRMTTVSAARQANHGQQHFTLRMMTQQVLGKCEGSL